MWNFPWSLHEIPRSLHGVWIIKLRPICRENPRSIISHQIPRSPHKKFCMFITPWKLHRVRKRVRYSAVSPDFLVNMNLSAFKLIIFQKFSKEGASRMGRWYTTRRIFRVHVCVFCETGTRHCAADRMSCAFPWSATRSPASATRWRRTWRARPSRCADAED